MKRLLIFAALACAAIVPSSASAAWHSNVMHSPSGNIRCAVAQGTVMCTTSAPYRSVVLDIGYRAYRIRPTQVYGSGPVLQYGGAWGSSEFECDSEASGMTCTDNYDSGFTINRAGIETW